MFKKIKYCFTFMLIMAMMFGSIGCTTLKDTFTKSYLTESGKVLPNSFGSVYQFNGLAKDLYDVGLKLSNDGYEKGLITDDQAMKIIEKARIYEDLQVLGSQSIIVWYDSVDNGELNSIDKKKIALDVLSDVIKNGQEFVDLINVLSNGQIKVPEGLIPTLMTLFELIEGV